MNEGMENLKQIEDLENNTTQLKRIADAIEEILRLVKKDMEPRTKKEKYDDEYKMQIEREEK